MIPDLEKRLEKLDLYFKTTNSEMSHKERLFSRIIKLNEEVGELCEAVLFENDKNQRQKDTLIDLDAELADIMICTLLIAAGREKDIWKEVDTKLRKLESKFNLN